jgi:hypothetical protein
MSDLAPNQNNFILYTTPEGAVELNVLLENETIWLTQEQMSQLFDRERSVITKHIANVFREGELEEKSNVQILHISDSDKPVKFYNLVQSPINKPFQKQGRNMISLIRPKKLFRTLINKLRN